MAFEEKCFHSLTLSFFQPKDGNLLTLQEVGMTKGTVQQRANQLARELHALEGTDNIIRILGERGVGTSAATANGAGFGRKQTALHSFFAKAAPVNKVSSVVILSDAEYDDDDRVAKRTKSGDSSSPDEVIEIDMSPEKEIVSQVMANAVAEDPEGIKADADSDEEVVSLSREKRRETPTSSEESPSSAGKKMRTL
jgi:hypothetical protein